MLKFKYFVLRYTSNVISGEFLNIGLILLDATSPETGFCGIRFGSNWKARVLCWDPYADVAMLQALFVDIKTRLGDSSQRGEMLRMMEDSFSNLISLSPGRECFGQDGSEELERLAAIELET
jgi:Protein of unknown function (DUF3037)